LILPKETYSNKQKTQPSKPRPPRTKSCLANAETSDRQQTVPNPLPPCTIIISIRAFLSFTDPLTRAKKWCQQKLNEFLALTQGNHTVLQYAQVFNHLCQYVGHHADMDAKKQDRFRRGLNTKLKERLNLVRPNSFNELVNMAIT
jgi:hypothetical protein